jgi:hypothetical protein
MKDYCSTLEEKTNNGDNRNSTPIKKGRVTSSNAKNSQQSHKMN